MKSKLRKPFLAAISAFVVGFAVVLGASAANAVYYPSSTWYYGPVNGYTYWNQAAASNDGRTYASASVGTTAASIPGGWASVNARLFLATGELCKQTGDWIYGGTKSFGLSTSGSGCALPSYYYGWGVTGAWNGSNYQYYYTNKSPWVNGV